MTRIVIIGGGIGGLAAAASLKARGISSTIYERALELREVGAALALWPNATRVLKRIGVLEDLVGRAHVPPAGALRDFRGRVLAKLTAMETDVPTIFAHRADLHRAIISAIPKESLCLGKMCTGIQREGKRVRAVFGDGSDSGWADGLIGADGIHSVIREQTLQDGAPEYRGYIAWRGVANFHSTDEVVGESWGRGQRFGFIPLGGGRIGWWATANKPGSQGNETCASASAKWKHELLQRFKGWHDPIPTLLESTPESAILCNAILDRAPPGKPRPWGEGPVTLLGDAAHPTTPNLGQGACMAIEDAAVVAHALASIPDIAAAFRVYEQTRFARTAMIVRESLKMGRMGQWQNAMACTFRNMLLKMAPQGRMRRQFRDLWLYDAWETPLVMPAAS